MTFQSPFPVRVIAFKYYSLQYLAPNEEEGKHKNGKKRCQPFKSLGNHFNQKEKGLQQWSKLQQQLLSTLFLHFCDQKKQLVIRE